MYDGRQIVVPIDNPSEVGPDGKPIFNDPTALDIHRRVGNSLAILGYGLAGQLRGFVPNSIAYGVDPSRLAGLRDQMLAPILQVVRIANPPPHVREWFGNSFVTFIGPLAQFAFSAYELVRREAAANTDLDVNLGDIERGTLLRVAGNVLKGNGLPADFTGKLHSHKIGTSEDGSPLHYGWSSEYEHRHLRGLWSLTTEAGLQMQVPEPASNVDVLKPAATHIKVEMYKTTDSFTDDSRSWQSGLSPDGKRFQVVGYRDDPAAYIADPILETFGNDPADDTIRWSQNTDITKKNLARYIEYSGRLMAHASVFGSPWELPSNDARPEINHRLVAAKLRNSPWVMKALMSRLRTAFHIDPQQAFIMMDHLGLLEASPTLSRLTRDQREEIAGALPNREMHAENLELMGNSRYNGFGDLINKVGEFGLGTLSPDLGWTSLIHFFPGAMLFKKQLREFRL